jgi:hypothetical protein
LNATYVGEGEDAAADLDWLFVSQGQASTSVTHPAHCLNAGKKQQIAGLFQFHLQSSQLFHSIPHA